MALNVKIQTYRGPLSSMPATTGFAGVLWWATDSSELFIDNGTAFQRVAPGNQVFTVTGESQLVNLNAMVGDIAVAMTGSPAVFQGTYMLTAYPASTLTNWQLIAQGSGSGVDVQPLGSPVAHEWVTYIDAVGVQHLAQPAFSDISGTLSQAQLPATIGAGSNLTVIDCGTTP